MSARCRFAQTLWLSLLVVVVGLAGQAAHAYTHSPGSDYYGPSFSFTNINEFSSYGDPDPLFGAPSGSNNQLTFSPTVFSASGNDQTGSQLQIDITATGLGATIDSILLEDFGTVELSGTGGAGTSAFAIMAGKVTVLEVLGVSVTPYDIDFTGTAVFDPIDLGTVSISLPTYEGITNWTGTVLVDIASLVPNATKVKLSFDNDLFSGIGAVGDTAVIKKDSVVITVIPEPGTFALICGGLLALSLRGRSRWS